MTIHRISFIFDAPGVGWTEQWYLEANDPVSAINIVNVPAFWQNYMAARGDQVVCKAVRANQFANPRVAYLQLVQRSRLNSTGGPVNMGDQDPSWTAYFNMFTGNFRHRAFQYRGSYEYTTTDLTGTRPMPPIGVLNDMQRAFTAAQALGLQILSLDTPNVLTNPDRLITVMQPLASNNNYTEVTYTGLAVPAGSRLIFHGLRRTDFPGFRGTIPSQSLAGPPTQVIVPVRWTYPLSTFTPVTASFRVAEYSLQQLTGWEYIDVRTRRIGRPLLEARGRRSALRFRGT